MAGKRGGLAGVSAQPALPGKVIQELQPSGQSFLLSSEATYAGSKLQDTGFTLNPRAVPASLRAKFKTERQSGA